MSKAQFDQLATQINADLDALLIGSDSIVNIKKLPFNAVGDGITNDRAAIQSALDKAGSMGGGIVWCPPATYKVAGTGILLNVPANVELRGIPGRRENGVDQWSGSVIDARTVTAANSVILDCFGADNTRICGLSIRGPGTESIPDASPIGESGVTGIRVYGNTRAFLSDIYIAGYSVNILLQSVHNSFLSQVDSVSARNIGLSMHNAIGATVHGGNYANSGRSNRSTDGNIRIGGHSPSGARSNDVELCLQQIDESGFASLGITAADDVTVNVKHIFAAGINSNGIGPGYGIKLGDGLENPNRVIISGCYIYPFASHQCTNTIHAQGNNHTFIGVHTNPANGSGDIVDIGLNSRWFNVNGLDK